MTDQRNNSNIQKLAEGLVNSYNKHPDMSFIDVKNLPVREKILEILELLIELLFPGYTGTRTVDHNNINFIVGETICTVRNGLSEQVSRALHHQCRLDDCTTCDCEKMAIQVTDQLLEQLPVIRETLKTDIEAAFDGDPAARSFEEIVISYPCVIAIAIHRIAHELYIREIPLIPRIMSESAHERTGIDIHPGAKIGKRFFIDHGTGVVIGETAVIGDNVKLYQGVTLGAKSFPKDERGRIIKGRKRHPTLENNVTVYAEATILGDVTIGEGSVISGNVWLIQSVPPGVTVATVKADSLYKHKKDKDEFDGMGAHI